MVAHPASELVAEVPEVSSFLLTGSKTVDRDEQVSSEFSNSRSLFLEARSGADPNTNYVIVLEPGQTSRSWCAVQPPELTRCKSAKGDRCWTTI